MKLLSDDGTTRIFADAHNLLLVDPAGMYLYHLDCGGLKMSHVIAERDYASLKEYHEVIRATTFPCECAPHTTYKPTTQQTLANLYVSIGALVSRQQCQCGMFEEVRDMVMRAASRDEEAQRL